MLLILGCEQSGSPGRYAQQGLLDLSAWSFKNDGTARLEGEWAFYWQEFISPTDFSQQVPGDPDTYINVPGSWDGIPLANTQTSGQGFATYRLQVMLPDHPPQLAIKIIDIGEAFDLYVNGKLTHSEGETGDTADTSKPAFQRGIIELPSNLEGTLDIVLHVSSFHYRTGGVWEQVALGPVADIQSMHELSLGYVLFLAGGISIIALYHIALFLRRRQDSSPLYFGLFCIAIVARILTTDERILTQLLPMISFSVLIKIEYVSFLLAISAFAGYISKPIRDAYPTWMFHTAAGGGVIFSALVLTTSVYTFSQLLPIFQAYLLVSICFGVYVFVRGAVLGRETAWAFLFGFTALALAALNEVFVVNGLFRTPFFLVGAGLFCFIFIQSYALLLRFANSLTTVETLSRELEKYAATLEKKVEQRTSELAEANLELERLASVDSLTQLANRRIFDESLLREWASHSRRGGVLSLLLCDIDYFKQYNDSYGHLSGDEALRSVATAISQTLHRQIDMVARYGGEEFVVLLPDTSAEGAVIIAQQITNAIRALHIPHKTSQIGTELSISCGAAAMIPQAKDQPGQLISRADEALYKAKSQGRNRVTAWS
ncbi:MAG: diguanylate cyclase (GGDEF)-like protein [Halieaceae bacterium]|jgi:diguanylate cyclase (GGDEF)-like protein